MFNFGKKRPVTGPGVVDKSRQAKDIAATEAVLYGKDLVVHVMPGRFRNSGSSGKQAKKTGILVLFIGVIFLLSTLILLYYYILKPRLNAAPAVKTTPPISTASDRTENPTPAQQTPVAQAPSGNQNEAGSAATTTRPLPGLNPVDGNNPVSFSTSSPEIATSAPEIATTTGESAASGQTAATSTAPNADIQDLDHDGLSDAEELVIGSNVALPDSDGDGYSDLTELANLYDPAGEGKITDSGAFATYTNATYKYSLIYSPSWPIKKFGGDDSVMFDIDGSQFFQIIVQPNADKQSIEDWYGQEFGADQYDPALARVGNGWQGIAKPGGLIYYLTDNNRDYIVTLTYNLGGGTAETYKNIFELLVKTFAINE